MTSPIRSQYEDFMRHVHTEGVFKAERTETGTKSVFGYQMRFNLNGVLRPNRRKFQSLRFSRF